MNIFVITPIYATTTEGDGATPLVHYFAREWVKMGHNVTVFNFQAKFPRPYYWIGKLFQHQLNSRFGILVPTIYPKDKDYLADGVKVHKRCITKFKPHTEYNNKNIEKILHLIDDEICKVGTPDCFIGHWDSPCLEILPILKEKYNRPITIVFHTNVFNFEVRYGSNILNVLKKIDIVGYRSKVAKIDFEKKYFVPKKSFICYSGVSDAFLSAGETIPTYEIPIRNFAYVGSLIARKHASKLYDALCKSYPDGDFSVKYIGNGAEQDVIDSLYNEKKLGTVEFTGRIPRESIIEHLQTADVFAMISEGEIFGLVYLEAMALGLITIGSCKEGIDGIIIDGVNGFLCEAGNSEELASIISKIKNMPREEIVKISANARQTALKFSDYNVAKQYINTVL